MFTRVAYSFCIAVLAFLPSSISPYAVAQSAQSHEHSGSGVPRVVQFSGVLRDAVGHPLSGIQGISFAVYADATGGVPLWEETQNVQFVNGRYSVLLGVTTTEGIPLELFAATESRWLGVRSLAPGEQEQPRTLLTSVPYALRAADADALGGLPSSAYARVDQVPPVETAPSAGPSSTIVSALGATPPSTSLSVTTPGGTAGYIPVFSGASSVVTLTSKILQES